MKKIITILLSLILLIGLVPIEALAISTSELDNLEKYFKNSDSNVDYMLENGIDTIIAGESDILTVMVYNRNGNTLSDATISLDLPAGISIAYGAANQVLGRIRRNEVAYAEFPIVADSSIQGKSAKITANVEGYYWTDDEYKDISGTAILVKEGVKVEDSFSETFFVPIQGGGNAGDGSNPILLLTDYSCGGSVLAGSTFGLGLTLLNTSKVDIHNIKVTVAGASFVPVGSSNSFYIDTIAAGESISKTMTMSCPKDTLQGAQSLVVSSTYNEGSASDTISIPVVQETRLVIDDILDPGWLVMGEMCYLNVSYRNMGNNQINNLTITVDGDFDMDGNPVEYVGNLMNGRQDNFSFNFFPRQEGLCTGTVTFTYEDANGNEHNVVKDFSLNIGPAYVWEEDPGMYDDPGMYEESGMPTWAWIAIGAGALVAIIVLVVVLKKRKAKKQEALDLDE